MKPNTVMITNVTDENKFNGCNITLQVQSEGFSGKFRIAYSDDSRKNSRHKSLTAVEVYFEGSDNANEVGYSVKHVTNIMLCMERKKQWILEAMEMKESIYEKKGMERAIETTLL